jgi:hypothetical protein
MSNLLNEINKHIFFMLGMPAVFQKHKTERTLNIELENGVLPIPIYGFNISKFSFLFADTSTENKEFRLVIKYDDFVSGILCTRSEGYTYLSFRHVGGWVDSDLLSQTTLLHGLLQLEDTVFTASALDENTVDLMKTFIEDCDA